jgi:hypothetical protein
MKRFPETLLVKMEEERGSPYFIAMSGVAEEDNDGQQVAVYRLASVGVVEITKRIIPKRFARKRGK